MNSPTKNNLQAIESAIKSIAHTLIAARLAVVGKVESLDCFNVMAIARAAVVEALDLETASVPHDIGIRINAELVKEFCR